MSAVSTETLWAVIAGLTVALVCCVLALVAARAHDRPAPVWPVRITQAPLPDLPAGMPVCGPGVVVACRVVTA